MRLGVLGGGQLARMLAIAGHPLGVTCTVLDPSPEACAGPVASLLVAAYDDSDGLDRLAAASDVVTFEFENPPAASAQRLAAAVEVHPPPGALETAQDRLLEKRLFEQAYQEPLLWWHRIVPSHKTVMGWKMSPSHNLGAQLEDVWLNT